jgi:ADP-dependent phosphofructokinase/glucokinase
MNKTKRVELRLNEIEYEQLKIKADMSNLTLSSYLRDALKNSSVKKAINKTDYKDLARQVRCVGVNINEIAHVLNIANQKDELDNYDYDNLKNILKIQESILLDILYKKSS